jgi:Uma2 family endonuclease
VWEYGKPPEVVIEIVSNREAGEFSSKLTGYAKVGVKYYVVFDPEQLLSDRIVRAFCLDAMNHKELHKPYWFPGVELGLRLWAGSFEGRHETNRR